MVSQGNDKIFEVNSAGFEPLALDVFRFQYAENSIYKSFVDALQVQVSEVGAIEKIPFLPIRFFKSNTVMAGEFIPEAVFESSGTTGMINSRHYVADLSLYTRSFASGFNRFYGAPSDYCILGLLPSYLERKNSSLVYMVDWLIKNSNHPGSGFYLEDQRRLRDTILNLEKSKQKTLLIGVSFALLDFAEKFPIKLEHTIIMETGGMKGRRKEMIREEMHSILKSSFGLNEVHSEYGMTELLSQAYSRGEGLFTCAPWMKILLRDESDPLTVIGETNSKVTGAINVIDLANINSCSFIATEDAGRLHPNGQFEVIGRLDGSDLRGCSLMVV